MKIPGITSTNIHWVKDIDETPNIPTLILCHEFFDALPIYQFEFREKKWKERHVAMDDQGDLRVVLSP